MNIETKIKTAINTLSLIGYSIKELKTNKLSDWEGISAILESKDNSENNISIMMTKVYCGAVGKKIGAITINHENQDTKTIENNLDKLVESIINALEGNNNEDTAPITGLKTVTIPEGDFTFKGNKTHIEEFEMCQTCITWNDWDEYIKANPDKDIPNDDAGFGRGNRPVINVSWLDIQDYIKWLNHTTGEEYALPTEEQWEYACRGGTNTDYYTGDTIHITQANFYTDDVSIGSTTPVASYPPNPFNLYDMHGNV